MVSSYGPVPPSTALVYEPPSEAPVRPEGRMMAVVAHGGAFFGWFLVPLAVWLIERKRSPYAEYHALQAMLWSLLGTLVTAMTCGLALPVFMLFHAWAAVKLLRDEEYEYPVVGRLARDLIG